MFVRVIFWLVRLSKRRQLTGEERLVRNVFGEKADERKDSSLKAKPGCEGVVIHADVFHRDSEQKDERAKEIAKAKKKRFDAI